MKKHRKEEEFLEQARKIPNISLACEKTGLSRNTIYRWRKEDPEFAKRLDEALATGVESVNDLAESKLIAHLNNGNLRAIEYWLDNNKKKYARPRPKSFWEDIFRRDSPITAIKITVIDKEDPKKVEKAKQKIAKRHQDSASEST